MVGQMIRVPLIGKSSASIDNALQELPALLYATQKRIIDLRFSRLVAFLDVALFSRSSSIFGIDKSLMDVLLRERRKFRVAGLC